MPKIAELAQYHQKPSTHGIGELITSYEKPFLLVTKTAIASYTLVATLCLLSLIYGLLPGLLAVCLGYLLALGMIGTRSRKLFRLSPSAAAAIVILMPIGGLIVFVINAKGMAFGAISQYQALLRHLAGTVLEIRQKLPADLAAHLPDGILSAQVWLADYLKSQASALADAGTSGLYGGLLVYLGLVVGALIVGTKVVPSNAELRLEIRKRAIQFIEAFRQIVVAQFWIATVNASCTAIFLLFVLPYFGVSMPYVGALIALTFFAGLIPIVGNLLCNGVLALVGLSVSPSVGLSCFLFLVAIHKSEYVINAKVVGKRTNTPAWELLAVIFAGEAIFGLPGLVAAPLFYAYAKKELIALRLV
jgi:predicted PurR-regulated permease PerM